MSHWLTVSDCKLILQSLLNAELSTYRGTPIPAWQDPPEIDSLERLHLAGFVNEFFCLHETGAEDRLLMTTSLDDWAALVVKAIPDTSGLTFRTSGSTGVPVAHHHCWQDIEAEVSSLAERLAPVLVVQRVLSWLPLHHLYGFMLGIALPAKLNLPRASVTGAVLPELRPGDLLVTVPPRWDYLVKTRRAWPAELCGVTSAGPLSAATAQALHAQGLRGLLDIYGSTETGGIASRWQTDTAYQLLAHWQRHEPCHIQHTGNGAVLPLQDKVIWHNDRSFMLDGRLDDVVVIGGVNVSPAYVVQRLETLQSVSKCAVRATMQASQLRLKAFVVPQISEEEAASEIAQATASWPAAERPVTITYGVALPTNSIGKLADW